MGPQEPRAAVPTPEEEAKRDHDDGPDQLRDHLQLFVDADNHARRLRTVRGLTPYEFICRTRTKKPERFGPAPSHRVPEPCTSCCDAITSFLRQSTRLLFLHQVSQTRLKPPSGSML